MRNKKTLMTLAIFGAVSATSLGVKADDVGLRPSDERRAAIAIQYGERLQKQIRQTRQRLEEIAINSFYASYGTNGKASEKEIRKLASEIAAAMRNLQQSQDFRSFDALKRMNAYRQLSSVFQETGVAFLSSLSSTYTPEGENYTEREVERINKQVGILLAGFEDYAQKIAKIRNEARIAYEDGNDPEGVYPFVNDLRMIEARVADALQQNDPSGMVKRIAESVREERFLGIVINGKSASESKQQEILEYTEDSRDALFNLFIEQWSRLNTLGAEVDPLAELFSSMTTTLEEITHHFTDRGMQQSSAEVLADLNDSISIGGSLQQAFEDLERDIRNWLDEQHRSEDINEDLEAERARKREEIINEARPDRNSLQ